jgi:Mg-chelatase subunit ChlD
MRVLASRDSGSADGSVNLLFGPLFGVTDFEPVQLSTAMRTDRDIALVLDVSGSMASGGRFEALSQGVNEFLNILDNSPQNETVSLTVYSTTDRKLVDMTQNTQAIRDAFAAESPGGRTAIGLGLRTGLDSVLNDVNNRPFALKSIVVMTDGRHNEGIAPDVVALDAAAAGITVHTLTFGSGANQALMQEVAALTGGDHRQADTNAELIEAFEEIARQLSVLLIE